MARHRHVRNLDADDYADDYDDYGVSPGAGSYGSYGTSPSMAQYLYQRGEPQGYGIGDFLTPAGGQQQQPAQVDPALMDGCLEEAYEVVGPEYREADVRDAILYYNYDVEAAVEWLLEQPPDSGGGVGSGGVFEMEGLDGADEEPPQTQPAADKEPQDAAAFFARPRPAITINLPSPSLRKASPAADDSPSGASASLSPLALALEDSQGAPVDVPSPLSDSEGRDGLKKQHKKAKDSGKEEATSTASPATAGKKHGGGSHKAKKQRAKKKHAELLKSLQQPTKQPQKEPLNMVVIGHVDAGKSTLMGHVLYRLGVVPEKEMRKFQKESEKAGKGSFSFAWVLDSESEARNRGVTINVGLNHFETRNRTVTLLDAPGHLDFVPNMIMGAAQADCALLVIDASPGAFEKGFTEGGQSREHALLARSLGVKELIVVINKLDTVDWAEARFQEIRSVLYSFLTKTVRFKKSEVRFVPTSGMTGHNLTHKPDLPSLQSWYKDGPCLVDLIDTFKPSPQLLSAPFRFVVSDVFREQSGGGGGLCVTGRVDSGFIAPSDTLIVQPLGEPCQVKAVKSRSGDTLPVAPTGHCVDLRLNKLDETQVHVGDVLCDPAQPLMVTNHFRAQILTFSIDRALIRGAKVVLHMHSVAIPATLSKLVAILNSKTGERKENRPRGIRPRSTALVEVTLSRAIPLSLFREENKFGRFMLRDKSDSVAAGIVIKLMSPQPQ